MTELKKSKRRKSKNILLGVASSAACYKALTLAGIFVKNGHRIKTVMTPAAAELISPVLFNAITNAEVYTEMFSRREGFREGHIALSEWADVFVIAPVTANTIGKIALGICDNLLTTLAVSRKAPLWLAPAMETSMWKNSVVRENVKKLKKNGVKFIGPVRGRLASGSTGIGRMTEPETIAESVLR